MSGSRDTGKLGYSLTPPLKCGFDKIQFDEWIEFKDTQKITKIKNLSCEYAIEENGQPGIAKDQVDLNLQKIDYVQEAEVLYV